LICPLRGSALLRRALIIFSIKRGMDGKPRISAAGNEMAGLLGERYSAFCGHNH